MEHDYPFHIVSHTIPLFSLRQYPNAVLCDNDDLFLAVKQYIPKAQPMLKDGLDPVTIIAAGGLGFIKELYEPLFSALLLRANSRGFNIRSIWIADPVNIGASAQSNSDNLGCDPSWFDHVRDLWTMICHIRQDMITPMMALGHCLGCFHLASLSIWHPRLFSAMIFIEPALDPEYGKGIIVPWTAQILRRKEEWTDKEQAEDYLVSYHRAKSWDPQVVARLKEYGLRQLSKDHGSMWSWTVNKQHEASTIFRFDPINKDITKRTTEEHALSPDRNTVHWSIGPFYNPGLTYGWNLLPELRPQLLYINGGKSPYFGKPSTRDWRARITGTASGGSGGMVSGTVKQIIIEDGQHTMPFDMCIGEIAEHTSQYMKTELERYREGDKARRAEWQKRSTEEKQSLAPGFVKAVVARVEAERARAKPRL